MNSCKEFKEKLVEVAFGDSEASPALSSHLQACPACSREFEAMQFAALGIEDARPVPAPSLSNERLHQAILARELKNRASWLPRLSFAGAAAALALAAWLGFNQPEGGRPEDVLAETKVHSLSEPSGAIEIPEETPDIIVPPSAEEGPALASRVETPSPKSSVTRRPNRRPSQKAEIREDFDPIPDDLLAVAVGGAEGALEMEMLPASFGPVGEPAPGATLSRSADTQDSETQEKPIIVIQPKGRAMEKSSDDVPIGG